MIPKVKIAQILIDRLQKIKEEHCGWVYGTVYGDSQYIFGVFKENEWKNGDIHFPANMDLCGAFQIGDVDLEVAKRLFKDVDVTDNPVLIQIPSTGQPNIYHFINNKLENIEMIVVPQQILYAEFVYVRLQAQVPLQTILEPKALQEEMLNIRKKFSAGKIAFSSPNSDLYLLGSNENMSYEQNMNGCTSIGDFILKLSDSDKHKYVQKVSEDLQISFLNMDLYTRATLDPTDEEILHAPFINIEKIDSTALQIILNVDGMALIHKDTSLAKLYTILVECACRNVRLFMDFISEYLNENDNHISHKFLPEIVHFYPLKLGHFVSRVININTTDSAEEEKRKPFHNNFLLLKNRPYFRRTSRYIFDRTNDTSRFLSPHISVPASKNGGELALVQGNYDYFHYCQDNMDDDGWGCAYRSFQTLASWFKHQGFCERQVPTFKEIQKCLHDIGDKPANFVGSKQWIGSTEVSYVLESLLGVTSKILYVSSGEEMASKGPELVYHFNKYGTPIMIGGGVLAHTILGVDYNRNTGDIMYLILDPHYKGKDDIKTIVSKGWCGWKDVNFWDKKSYYNMCMPQVTECI